MDAYRILFQNARIFTPVDAWQPGWLVTENRRILHMGPGQPPSFPEGYITRLVEASGLLLLPGFIDLHVHGAMGYDVMEACPDELRQMAAFFARHGVTGFLATTWTATRPEINQVLETIKKVLGPVGGGANVLGAHLEGPYLNPSRSGAQDPAQIRRVCREEALEWLGTGIVRLVALAPEFQENLWLVEECVRRGITVAAGHTTADFATMQQSVSLGLRQVTHCFNAMDGLNHRHPGTVGAAMIFPELVCELIADNIHVAPEVQKILVQVKGPSRVILVTDAIRGTGLPDGDYTQAGRQISIRQGAVRLADGTLAGSTLTMDRALANIQQSTGLPLNETWPMSSLNPARAIGLSAAKGSLETGKDADLVLIAPDYIVHLTVVEGRIVYEA